MTTIATDGKVIAADSRGVSDFILQGNINKVFRLKDGSIAAFAGHSLCYSAAIEWLNGGEKPNFKDAEFYALILDSDGVWYVDDNYHKERMPAPYAIGSGCKFAMAAMLAGASPKEAVRIASKLDENTGGRIRVMEYAKQQSR